MKIVYIYRQFTAGMFGIETPFHTVADELEHVDLIEYELGPRISLLRDVWRLRRLNADVYHVTGDVNYLAIFLPRKKTVLTVHDIGHFLFDLHGLRRWLYKWLWLKWPMRTSAVVTVVSKATADTIVKHLGIEPDRLKVIENCHDPLFRNVPCRFNKTYPVILQVGTYPHKNVPRLIAAIRGIPCKLVLIGKLDEPTRKQLAESGTDFENRINLTNEEIAQAYADCDIVTFLSTGEGFGMPIIEAQASGRPLITADIPPMSVVAGDGACKVSALDIAQIRAGILKIIGDDEYRTQIVKAGIRNAARFSPQNVSAMYFTIYKCLNAL